jgi:hypothetical protein
MDVKLCMEMKRRHAATLEPTFDRFQYYHARCREPTGPNETLFINDRVLAS